MRGSFCPPMPMFISRYDDQAGLRSQDQFKSRRHVRLSTGCIWLSPHCIFCRKAPQATASHPNRVAVVCASGIVSVESTRQRVVFACGLLKTAVDRNAQTRAWGTLTA
jgi:hypothetical protein